MAGEITVVAITAIVSRKVGKSLLIGFRRLSGGGHNEQTQSALEKKRPAGCRAAFTLYLGQSVFICGFRMTRSGNWPGVRLLRLIRA